MKKLVRRYYTMFTFASGEFATAWDCDSYEECEKIGQGWAATIFKSPIVKRHQYFIDHLV